LERFALESCIEFTADFNRCLVHGLDGSLFTQFSVRQFEAASNDECRMQNEETGQQRDRAVW